MRSHFTRLAAARKILGCQSLVSRQLWHLYMECSLSLAPTLAPWSLGWESNWNINRTGVWQLKFSCGCVINYNLNPARQLVEQVRRQDQSLGNEWPKWKTILQNMLFKDAHCCNHEEKRYISFHQRSSACLFCLADIVLERDSLSLASLRQGWLLSDNHLFKILHLALQNFDIPSQSFLD